MMPRRVHVEAVLPGEIVISNPETHHLRDVLRLGDGAAVEVFDDTGRVARAILRFAGQSAIAHVETFTELSESQRQLIIASAMPKGNRADWMIEKLSELGVHGFVPLVTRRSVVLAEGKNKLERFRRIATEAAKQSHRSGVLQIDAVQSLEAVLQDKDINNTRSTAPPTQRETSGRPGNPRDRRIDRIHWPRRGLGRGGGRPLRRIEGTYRLVRQDDSPH